MIYSQFANTMKQLGIGPAVPILLAVSGGSDSLGLLAVATKYSKHVRAATIDHSIINEPEAPNVGEICKQLEVPHTYTSIDWAGRIPTSSLEEKMREKRYEVLNKIARRNGIKHIVTGHTLDDQIQTVVMRLRGNSGLSGLRGMDEKANTPVIKCFGDMDIEVVRPLLNVCKSDLAEVCKQNGFEIYKDPMNEDIKRFRNRTRIEIQKLIDSGEVSFDELAHFARYLASVANDFRKITTKHLRTIMTDTATSSIQVRIPESAPFNSNHWLSCKPIACNVILGMLKWVSGSVSRNNQHSVEKVYDEIVKFIKTPLKKRVLLPRIGVAQGCLIIPDGNKWTIVRASPNRSNRFSAPTRLEFNKQVFFDKRYFITVSKSEIKNIADMRIDHFNTRLHSIFGKNLMQAIKLNETHDLVVRHYSTIDEGWLSSLLNYRRTPDHLSRSFPECVKIVDFDKSTPENTQNVDLATLLAAEVPSHPAWRQYRRAMDNFKRKIPEIGRFSLPVIALTRRDGISGTGERDMQNYGLLVAVPALGINLLPWLFSYNVNYRFEDISTADSEVDDLVK